MYFDRFMVPEYRRPLIMQEILGYNADIICLQEVDEKAFATFFQPLMSYAGASLLHAALIIDRATLCLSRASSASANYNRDSLSSIVGEPGFEGHYTNKAGATAEGSAVFYRSTRYELVRRADIPMKRVFASLLAGDDSSRARHAQFLPLLQASPHLVQALQRVSWPCR